MPLHKTNIMSTAQYGHYQLNTSQSKKKTITHLDTHGSTVYASINRLARTFISHAFVNQLTGVCVRAVSVIIVHLSTYPSIHLFIHPTCLKSFRLFFKQ